MVTPAAAARGFSRRDGLKAAVLLGPVALLAACTDDSPPEADASASGGSAAGAAPELGTAEAVDESRLISAYDAVLADADDVPAAARAVLQSIRDQHVAHRDALGGAPAAPGPATPIGAWPGALADLVAAERAASRSRIRACVESADAELARVLTLIGASEAAHVPALRELGS